MLEGGDASDVRETSVVNLRSDSKVRAEAQVEHNRFTPRVDERTLVFQPLEIKSIPTKLLVSNVDLHAPPDSKGHVFLNQYVLIKTLGEGSFGKVSRWRMREVE